MARSGGAEFKKKIDLGFVHEFTSAMLSGSAARLSRHSVLAPAACGNKRPAAEAAGPLGFYDAEQHIGLVAENATENVAAANTLKLNGALAAMHAQGSFDFARGPRGPVRLPIVFAAKSFFFKGELQTSVKVGSGALTGGGGVGYPLGDGDFGPRGIGARRPALCGSIRPPAAPCCASARRVYAQKYRTLWATGRPTAPTAAPARGPNTASRSKDAIFPPAESTMWKTWQSSIANRPSPF